MTTLLEPEIAEIDWDELQPPCEAVLCNPKNPGELVVEKRHFDVTSCPEERTHWFCCEPCYDRIKKLSTLCQLCLEPASIFVVD